MRLFDFVYYCIYRYVLKTPDRAASDTWPVLVVAFTPFLNVVFLYEAFALGLTGTLWPLPRKSVLIAAFIVLAALGFWHYSWKQNGVRVVRAYEKRGHPDKYVRLGSIIWWETLLLPFIFAGIFITLQKLTGWPPHP
jgi:hypothetical protein